MNLEENSPHPAQAGHHVEQLVQASRRLLQQDALLLPGSGVSIKATNRDPFGEEEEMLYAFSFGRCPGEAKPEDLLAVLVEPMARLTRLDRLSDRALIDYVETRGGGAATVPRCKEAILHAALPARCIVHIYPDAVLAVANTPDGIRRLREVYDAAARVLPYAKAGLPLAQMCQEALSGERERPAGLVLMQQGVLGFGPTVGDACEHALDLARRAEAYLRDLQVQPDTGSSSASAGPTPDELSRLRRVVSDRCGAPVVLTTRSDPAWLAFARRRDLSDLARQGPVPEDSVGIQWRFPRREDLKSRAAADDEASPVPGAWSEAPSLPAPGVVLDADWGLAAFGRTAAAAQAVADIAAHARDIIVTAQALEAYHPLPPADPGASTEPTVRQAVSGYEDDRCVFSGEVALVTGAASGIGRACVQAFLDRGAAVVGLDINPDVTEMLDRPDFLGLVCDVTDEEAIREALRAAVDRFGGLDMLVPNAGMFPPGCRIDALSRDEWDKVMDVNLHANLALMREAYPLLKNAPQGGRAVIMGSRNVPAPGPGAVAYSVSKAGLVQMARVAALEWGNDGIRVNIINPHAVFDTGIWTDEVLQARADHYGLTVEQYKTRNVLGVEVTSRDVGELVAEMCGPLFAKTTGAQIPIDGGSERVI